MNLTWKRMTAGVCLLLTMAAFSGCRAEKNLTTDDLATNEGYSVIDKQTLQQQEQRWKQLKVGVLHIGDPAAGSGYTYAHDLGILAMQQNLELRDDQIIRMNNVPDGDEKATREALQACVDAGCNIIFTTSFGYMDATEEFAEKYPDIYFSHGTGYKSNGTNFNNYFGRIYQARYLSGIVAGMNTKTNKIGYVAAQDESSSEVTGGVDAFAMGVYAVNPQAEVYVKVTHSWYDPEGEEAAAYALLDMGCDVLAQHCDTALPMQAAQERGAFGIGYNNDMSKDAPEACLCSVVWNWNAYYTTAVQSVINSTWDGSNYFGGMGDNLLGLVSMADFCAPGTEERVQEAAEKIRSGELGVFDGAIETNTGETVGRPGQTLDDKTIQENIHWYFKTVNPV